MPDRLHPQVRQNSCTGINSISRKCQKLETVRGQDGYINCDKYRRDRARKAEKKEQGKGKRPGGVGKEKGAEEEADHTLV